MKKLIVISNDLYIRNFIQTGAFSEIEDNETYYVASDNVKHISKLKNKKNYLATIKEKKWRNTIFLYLFFPFLTFTYESKSSSFKFRSERLLHSSVPTPYKILHTIAFLSSRTFKKPMLSLYMRLLGYNKHLYEVIKKLKPDIVLVPSSAADVLGTDATNICKKLHIPVMHLINGWDNLSSKIVYPINPDYLCVWGSQSKEFAEKIHGISSSRVFEIGVPTFDSYFHIKKETLKSYYSFDYALFAGCAVPFDEISALRILDDAIEKANIKNFKIIYRPHPWRSLRSCFDKFEPEKFKHIVLDNQMMEVYSKQVKNDNLNLFRTSNFLPSLEYYPSLLHNARFVICPLSTMTLEAAIFERPVLVIAYDDGVHITSPHNLLKYDHFNGIETLDGMIMCKNKKDFGKSFMNVYDITKDIKKGNILEQLRYYIYYDEDTYSKRLKKVLNNLKLSTT